MNLPCSGRAGVALLALPLVFALAGVPPCKADLPGQQPPQILHSSPTVNDVAANTTGAVAGPTGPAAGASVTRIPDSVVEQTPANGEREDLTVFFFIGAIIDVLLVAAFLIWAVGQWRKTNK
jgi:hypothetical protein